MLTDLLITILLVLLNGFFVAAEFAIVKVRTSQLSVQSKTSYTARLATKVVNNLDNYLAATQLGITLASLGLGWIGEPIVAKLIMNFMNLVGLPLQEATAHQVALPVAFATITVLHIVFGELAPKSLAIRYPYQTTMALALPLRFFHVVFRPFIWLLNGFANRILRIIGIEPVPPGGIHSEEELKLIIAESAEGGAIEPDERELIQNVFDFDDRYVWQILRPRTQIAAIDIDTPLEAAIEYCLAEGYSRFPVYDGSIDHILGFVHAKDLLMLSRQKDGRKTLKDILRPVLYVSSNKKVSHLLRQFQKEHVQLAVVVNEFGGNRGHRHPGGHHRGARRRNPGRIRLRSAHRRSHRHITFTASRPSAHWTKSMKTCQQPLPESEDYHTLSGLLLQLSENIPQEGDVFTVGNYEIKILKMFQASPELVEVRYLEPSVQEEQKGQND
ncbi:MAG: UPF0053 protein YhdT [Saprospiraceae bacterium]|nr:MAG: UPF0053 protein YhdT [Saprospiraceae bacterium]